MIAYLKAFGICDSEKGKTQLLFFTCLYFASVICAQGLCFPRR